MNADCRVAKATGVLFGMFFQWGILGGTTVDLITIVGQRRAGPAVSSASPILSTYYPAGKNPNFAILHDSVVEQSMRQSPGADASHLCNMSPLPLAPSVAYSIIAYLQFYFFTGELDTPP
jgi:hypothetical protein